MKDELCEEKLIELGISVATMANDMASVKDILKSLSSNQEIIIRLRERQDNSEKAFNYFRITSDKMYKTIHELEQVKSDIRITHLEHNQRRFVYSALAMFVAGFTGMIFKMFVV